MGNGGGGGGSQSFWGRDITQESVSILGSPLFCRKTVILWVHFMFVIYTYLKNTSIFSFHPVILITKARNRTADNTLLIRIASNLYINCNMAALGWPGSCNIKVTSAELASAANVRENFGICSFHARSLHVNTLVFAPLTVRTGKEINLFTRSFCSIRF